MQLKIISWNLNYWQNTCNNPKQPQYKTESQIAEWKDRINEYLAKFNADIILLQETGLDYLTIPGCNVFFHELPGLDWGSAIVSKNYNAIHHSLSSTYTGSQVLLYYDFKIEEKTISIINIYAKGDYYRQKAYYNTTLHHMLSDIGPHVYRNKKNAIVLAGDFNASMQYELNNSERFMDDKPVFDRISDFGFINCTDKLQQTHVNHNNPDKPWHLDYMFINEHYQENKRECHVYNSDEYRKLSDHFPVELVIEI